MLSKNFLFTTLFFVVIVFFISCLNNKEKTQYKQFDTILPTDSGSFAISLKGLESIKTSNFDLDGKWKLIIDHKRENQDLYVVFKGRKIVWITDKINNIANREDKYKVFAMYDSCPDEGGIYTKDGSFLVVGSGREKLICYKVISYQKNQIILYDVAKGEDLKFMKMD